MTGLPLFDFCNAVPSIDGRFAEFDREHPDVWELFVRFAHEIRAAGHDHYSADAILHRVRWHCSTSGKDRQGFKVNDHYSRCYARKLMQEQPEFKGFFETRRLRARGEKSDGV